MRCDTIYDIYGYNGTYLSLRKYRCKDKNEYINESSLDNLADKILNKISVFYIELNIYKLL